jgi:hypothetical protein
MEVVDNPFSHYTGSSNPLGGNTSCINRVTTYVRWKLELREANLHLGTLFLDTKVWHLGSGSQCVDNHLKFVACHELSSFPNLLAGLLLFYARVLFNVPVAFCYLFRTALLWLAL